MKGSVLYSEYVRVYRLAEGAGGKNLKFLTWDQLPSVQRDAWNRLAKIWKSRAAAHNQNQNIALLQEIRLLKSLRPVRHPLSLTREVIFARHQKDGAEEHIVTEDEEDTDLGFRIRELLQ